jgi:hypothetical protein
MVFTQIWYLHKQGLQDQNKGITNCAEFTLQWRNYPIWRYLPILVYVLIECRIQIEIHSVYEWIRIRAREFLFTGLPTGYGSGTPVHFHGNKSFGKKVSVVHNLKSCTSSNFVTLLGENIFFRWTFFRKPHDFFGIEICVAEA